MKLNRPEGPLPGDLNLSRRMLGGAFFAGYAAFALGRGRRAYPHR